IWSVGHKSAIIDKLACMVNGWKFVPCSELYNPRTIGVVNGSLRSGKSFGPFSDHLVEGRPNLIWTTRFDRPKCQSQRGSGGAQLFQLSCNGWFIGIKQVCHLGDSWKSLFKQLQAFAA